MGLAFGLLARVALGPAVGPLSPELSLKIAKVPRYAPRDSGSYVKRLTNLYVVTGLVLNILLLIQFIAQVIAR
jgi:hypothetical protein